MFRIEEGKIYLTRGDTAYLSVKCVYPDGELYKFAEGDTLTLSVKTTTDEKEDYKIHKVISADNEAFVIVPDDTKDLEYGKYKYDIQLNTHLGEVFTIVGPATFYLKEEVTR